MNSVPPTSFLVIRLDRLDHQPRENLYFQTQYVPLSRLKNLPRILQSVKLRNSLHFLTTAKTHFLSISATAIKTKFT